MTRPLIIEEVVLASIVGAFIAVASIAGYALVWR
jgi:hypothetical protein